MASFKLYDTKNAIEYILTAPESSVGRSPESDIRLLSSSVSRNHGILKIIDGTLSYVDLGSSNGSYINAVKVDNEAPLKNSDTLQIGEFELKVSLELDQDQDATMISSSDDEATQIASFTPPVQAAAPESKAQTAKPEATPKPQAATNSSDIPAMWSEGSGLEQASGTEFFIETKHSESANNYHEGRLNIAPIDDTPRLVGLNLSVQGTLFPLTAKVSGIWKIGRDKANVDICIDESSVSGLHAQLINEGQRWKVVNWMSTNGTFVNEQKGLSTYLKTGDIIRLGSVEFAFELPAQQVADTSQSKPVEKKKGFFSSLFGK
jgi:pSer/pThr/pTyr-binding forkhead associated (FHA) protein